MLFCNVEGSSRHVWSRLPVSGPVTRTDSRKISVTVETTTEEPIADGDAALPVTSIEYFPLNSFAMIMGIVGLGLVWRDAAYQYQLPKLVGEVIIGFGAGFYLAILSIYGLKLIRFRDVCLKDIKDPSACNYLAAVGISLLLVAAGLAPYNFVLAEQLWFLGVAGQILATVYIVGRLWLNGASNLKNVTPAWFIPVVGIVVAPMTGAVFGHETLNWMIFGCAMFFWVSVFAVIVVRFLVHPPLPVYQRPLLVILIAPPSLCFAAYVELQGRYVDNVAEMLMGIALITGLLLLVRIRDFATAPFSIRWWAYTFPLTAFAKAALLFHMHMDLGITKAFSIFTLGLVTAIVILVFTLTMRFMFRGGLFLPQE